jgi:hypothetical protein
LPAREIFSPEDGLKKKKEAFQKTHQRFLNGFSKKAEEPEAVSDLYLLYKVSHELSGLR